MILIAPLIDRVHRVSLRIVTMPIQSQGIITKDNVSVDVSAVAYFRIKDSVRSVVAIENLNEAISPIAQTTLRAVVGRHTLDETLYETDKINQDIRAILDVQTEEWGAEVTVVDVKDIQLPETMKRAMARQAEAEREKRAKIIASEGEALAAGELAHASDNRCLDLVRAGGEGFEDWDLASALEMAARANVVAKNASEAARYAELAREELETTADPDDREVIESQLAELGV